MTIVGQYAFTIYRVDKTNYTKFIFDTIGLVEYRNELGNIVCCGEIPFFVKDTPLKLDGDFIRIDDEGYLFKVTSCSLYSENDENTVAYLVSRGIEGIGIKTAKAIVEVTGANIFDFIRKPEAAFTLSEKVKRLSYAKALVLIDKLVNSSDEQVVYDFLMQFEATHTHCSRVCKTLGKDAVAKLKENPFKAGAKADLPFFLCDQIHKYNGGCAYDIDRCKSLLSCALQQIMTHGNVYCYPNELCREVAGVIFTSAFREISLPKAFLYIVLFSMDNVYLEDDEKYVMKIFPMVAWRRERELANELIRMRNRQINLPYDEGIVSAIEKELGITYSDKQKECFRFLKNTGIKILTGGPGTGKTTVIKGLIKAYKELNPGKKIQLTAPTGRAAQRLAETTGMEASTIHRLLDFQPYGKMCVPSTGKIDVDLLIVDEMSMADEEIMNYLLAAVKTESLVVLCGDIHQLPSVGAGNVLSDLIDSKDFDTVLLDIVFRQEECSSIILNAEAVKQGINELICDLDFGVYTASSEEEVQEMVSKIIERNYDIRNPFSIQVLTSTKKNGAGTNALNRVLQSQCNKNKTAVPFGSTGYKIGDKIMMTRNNYITGYVNGDIGTLIGTRDGGAVVNLGGEDILIMQDDLYDMSLAYAMTIHKSQGSEYDKVIVVLPSNPSIMLKRNLLYTAITRAKKKVIVIEQKNSIKTAIRNYNSNKRKTGLLRLLSY